MLVLYVYMLSGVVVLRLVDDLEVVLLFIETLVMETEVVMVKKFNYKLDMKLIFWKWKLICWKVIGYGVNREVYGEVFSGDHGGFES